VRGRLMTLDTKDDRTLFFDMMPVFFRTQAGVKVKLKLYTVPGQVMHESTRRIVLQGTDAVAFVADSRRSEAASTLAYWQNMLKNLEANGLDYRTLPIVIQMNKRDLDDARGDQELGDLRRVIQPPVVPAVAIRGDGVVETLFSVLQLCYRSLDRSLALEAKWHVSEREFLDRIFSHVDVKGTRLSSPGGAAR
jgi:signal recognition particle receptor subunit beta